MHPSERPSSPSISRREVLKKTLFFSTGIMAGSSISKVAAAEPDTDFSGPGMHLLAVGDYGSKNEAQEKVARRMAAFAKELNQPLEAVLALGDNFYGKMTPDRFERHFEKMYDPAVLNCPFHACIGNHDYEPVTYGLNPEPRKFETQLDYAKQNPTSRWKMPAKWYALELPNPEKPLIKMIVLDSNVQEGALTPQEKLEQKRWAEAELAKGTKAPWLWMVWHHPLYTETTKRKDNPGLQRLFGEYLEKYPISICLSGHDHNLQHLRIKKPGPSFIVSGAGGANTYEVAQSERGFTQQILGFNHFHINEKRIKAQFVDADGKCLHAFRRKITGEVEIIS